MTGEFFVLHLKAHCNSSSFTIAKKLATIKLKFRGLAEASSRPHLNWTGFDEALPVLEPMTMPNVTKSQEKLNKPQKAFVRTFLLSRRERLPRCCMFECHTRKNDTNTSTDSHAESDGKSSRTREKALRQRMDFSNQLPHSTRSWIENRKPFSVFCPISRSGKEKVLWKSQNKIQWKENKTLKDFWVSLCFPNQNFLVILCLQASS